MAYLSSSTHFVSFITNKTNPYCPSLLGAAKSTFIISELTISCNSEAKATGMNYQKSVISVALIFSDLH